MKCVENGIQLKPKMTAALQNMLKIYCVNVEKRMWKQNFDLIGEKQMNSDCSSCVVYEESDDDDMVDASQTESLVMDESQSSSTKTNCVICNKKLRSSKCEKYVTCCNSLNCPIYLHRPVAKVKMCQVFQYIWFFIQEAKVKLMWYLLLMWKHYQVHPLSNLSS